MILHVKLSPSPDGTYPAIGDIVQYHCCLPVCVVSLGRAFPARVVDPGHVNSYETEPYREATVDDDLPEGDYSDQYVGSADDAEPR